MNAFSELCGNHSVLIFVELINPKQPTHLESLHSPQAASVIQFDLGVVCVWGGG